MVTQQEQGWIERMQKEETVKRTLVDIRDCFASRLPGVKWCLKYGTALAAVFGGHIIPGDNDLDIAVLAETCPEDRFIRAFDEAGFARGAFFHDPEIPSVGTVLRFLKHGIPFDCYWLYLRGRKRWWVTTPRVPHVLPAYLFEDLHPARVLGLELPAPYPIEVYCDHMWKKHEGSYPAWDKPGEPGESLHVFPEWEVKRTGLI